MKKIEFEDENIEIFETKDGSLGLFDKNLDEIFHDRFGAKKEAFEKFVEPAIEILKNKNNPKLKILDICYGIGYNTKTALKYLKNISKIDCVELSSKLVLKSFEFDFDFEINEIIKNNLKKPEFIFFHIGDLRKIIKNLDEKYDLIFYDGFSPYKEPSVWSEDVIFEISKKMKFDSILTTYNHSKPVLNAFKKANLFIGKTIKNGKTIGSVVSFNKENILNPLNSFELLELNTKSAITYKDKNLTLDDVEIIKNRELEIQNSKLSSLSKLKSMKKGNEGKL